MNKNQSELFESIEEVNTPAKKINPRNVITLYSSYGSISFDKDTGKVIQKDLEEYSYLDNVVAFGRQDALNFFGGIVDEGDVVDYLLINNDGSLIEPEEDHRDWLKGCCLPGWKSEE